MGRGRGGGTIQVTGREHGRSGTGGGGIRNPPLARRTCNLGLAQRYFSPELLASLRSWKDGRNPLIHELMKQKLSTEGLKEFALEGCQLVKTLKSKVGCFNRSIDRRKGREGKGL